MVRAGVRALVDSLGRPVDAVRAQGTEPRLVTLIYHRAGGRTLSPVDLSNDALAEQLDMLAASGRVVTLDEGLLRLGSPRRQDGPPSIVITVDDGTADWPDVLMPALVERGLPATFYVSTDFVERRLPFPDDGAPVSWDGLADMLSTGLATIGSHTHTHRVMNDLADGEARDEVDRSIELIEDRLGVTPHHFAYPKAVAPSPAAEVAVRRRFTSAVLAGNRAAQVGDDVHRLGRHALTVADDEESLRRKVDGGMLLEGWLRERRDAWQVSRSGRS
jgi:peptidoglycan/xylan/chitin deacetylase (PgdA/CDA1 family)